MFDTIWATKKQSNSDSDVKCATIQFYGNSHNSQSDLSIELKFYMELPEMFSYHGLKFQVNQSSGRHHNSGQQRPILLFKEFGLWTSYLARILFLEGCGSWF